MIGAVRKLLTAQPFVPFAIMTIGGNRYDVPRPGHCAIDPQSSRVVVWFDDGSGLIVAGQHIASLELRH